MSSTPAIICETVSKRFYIYDHRTRSLREAFIRLAKRRPLQVRRPYFSLRRFDICVRQGESVALIGSNGSGKSTALRLIAGIYPASEGRIVVNGRMAALIGLGAGFHPELTGMENVLLNATLLGLSRREISERLPQIAAFAEIGDFLSMPLKYYSSGMQTRLAFSVAIAVRPEILLLDEVLAVGDLSFQQRCLDHLRQFHASGKTLLIVSHDMAMIRDFCTRAVWLEKGEIRLEGDVNSVVDHYVAASAAQEWAATTDPG